MKPRTKEERIAHELEIHILHAMRARLDNWGRWWYRGNTVEVNKVTGKHAVSPMFRGAVRVSSSSSQVPVDDEDALNLHQIITSGILSRAAIAELRRYYSDKGGSGTSAQGVCRYRAVRKLAGL